MGTRIYGRYDELVIELTGWDAWRARCRRIRIPLDEIDSVRAAVVGPRAEPAVVIRTSGPGVASPVVVHRRDAEDVAADLVRRGVGAPVHA